MAIVVEDGTVVANANSYVSEAELTTYATARGVTITGNTEQLLIKAMDYIEGLDFIGVKYSLDQALQWPRVNVVIDSYLQDITTIPTQLKNGLMETALAIDAGNEPLSNLEREQQSVKVGDISVTYSSGANATTVVRKISNALAKVVKGSMKVDRG